MTSITFLGRPDSPILAVLRSTDADVTALEADAPLEAVAATVPSADWIVSHGYRRILPRATLAARPGRTVNCHISLLPWNRGADPNTWSVVEDTPAGVTMHIVDHGVDTGPVVAQREVAFEADDTLASSYARLQHAMAELFERWWPDVVAGLTTPRPQTDRGTVHRKADLDAIAHHLSAGWETPIAQLRGILPPHPGAPHPRGAR